MQPDIDAETRTKGLSIFARILAASLVRQNLRHGKPSTPADSKVDATKQDIIPQKANDKVGDER